MKLVRRIVKSFFCVVFFEKNLNLKLFVTFVVEFFVVVFTQFL